MLPLVVMNFGGDISGDGVEENFPHVRDALHPDLAAAAVYIGTEARMPDNAALRELVRPVADGGSSYFAGARYLACCREPAPVAAPHPSTHDGRRQPAQGGVIALTFNRSISLQQLRACQLGAMAVSLTVDGYDSVAVIVLYNPPAGSPLNRGNGDAGQRATEDLLSTVRKWYGELRRDYRTVAVCGDFNMRAGRHRNRRTADARPNGGRPRLFTRFLDGTGLQLLHGGPGQPAGHMTSRAVTDATGERAAEVDAILVPVTPRPGAATLEALPQLVPFDAFTGTSLTHVPVCAVVHLQHTGHHRNRGLPVRTMMPRLPYCDRRHHAAAGAVAAAIQRAARDRGHKSVHEVYDTLIQGLRSAWQSGYRSEPGCPCGRNDHGRDHRDCKSAILGSAEEYRLRRAKNAADKAYHRQFHDLRRLRAANVAQPLIAIAEQRVRQRLTERTVACRAVRAFHRRAISDRLQRLIKRMERLRTRDPTAFFREAADITSADLSTMPNSTPAVPMQNLVNHYTAVMRDDPDRSPAALTSADYAADIPVAPAGSGDRLVRPFTWWELYLLIFPADKQLLQYMEECSEGCTSCNHFMDALRASEWGNPAHPVPEWMPHLNTCRAAGEDGLVAEILCFTRPWAQAFAWRKRVSEDLAAIMSTWLVDGVPDSAGFREVQISAPMKPLKPGAAPPADPATNTRPISVSNIFAKLFELLISARTEHWRVASGLVGPEQAAFMQFQSAEMQVLTLRESLLWRRAQGKGTNVIFVDFKAAYDSVHQPLLWHVLRTMGVPEALIRVLEPWYASRTGRIKSGGELSAPFPINKGVPQGGPLSTLLWNLFIEPLSRRLRRLPGVTVAPLDTDTRHAHLAVNLTHLLFADDLAILTEPNSAAALEALQVTAEWGAAFGVRVNDGVGKTEAMHFAADAAAAEAATASLAPLEHTTADGQHLRIKWVPEYRYLGAQLRLDLDACASLQKRIAMLDATIARFFAQNRAISSLAVSSQLQLLSTVAIGAINYLLAVLPVPDAVAQAVDRRILDVAHRILGFPHNSLNAVLRLEVPGMPFRATCVMHQVRLLEYLRLTPLPACLAARITRLQEACGPGAQFPGAPLYEPFAQRVRAAERELCTASGQNAAQVAARSAPWTPPASIRDIHASVAVARRAVACREAYAMLPRPLSERQQHAFPITAETPIPAVPAIEHLRVLYYGGGYSLPADQGRLPYTTPMSVTGPNCGGSLPAVSTLNWHHTGPVMRLRLGSKAFVYGPFNNAYDAADDLWEDAELYDETSFGARMGNYASDFLPPSCPHCDSNRKRSTANGPWHLFLECTHGDVAQLRKELQASAPGLLDRLLEQIHLAYEHSGRRVPAEVVAERSWQLRALTEVADWTSADGKHVLYHLLTALPWPERAATARTPLTAWLGRLFDSTILERRHRRKIADTIIRWAAHWIRTFAALRWRLLSEAHALNAAASP